MRYYEEFTPYITIIEAASNIYGIPPQYIAGMIWQESRAGMILSPKGPGGTGDRGYAHGLMQIDIRYHKT